MCVSAGPEVLLARGFAMYIQTPAFIRTLKLKSLPGEDKQIVIDICKL